MSTASRTASAIALEPTKLLSLDRSHFATFVQIIPSFAQMFATTVMSYAKVNDLNEVIREGRAAKRSREKEREAKFEAAEAAAAAGEEGVDDSRPTSSSPDREVPGILSEALALDRLLSESSTLFDEPPPLPLPPTEGPLKGRGPMAAEVLENEFERAARHSVHSITTVGVAGLGGGLGAGHGADARLSISMASGARYPRHTVA